MFRGRWNSSEIISSRRTIGALSMNMVFMKQNGYAFNLADTLLLQESTMIIGRS